MKFSSKDKGRDIEDAVSYQRIAKLSLEDRKNFLRENRINVEALSQIKDDSMRLNVLNRLLEGMYSEIYSLSTLESNFTEHRTDNRRKKPVPIGELAAIEKIGAGTQASVYLAQSISKSTNKYAVKERSDIDEKVLNEVRAAGDSKHVVKYYGVVDVSIPPSLRQSKGRKKRSNLQGQSKLSANAFDYIDGKDGRAFKALLQNALKNREINEEQFIEVVQFVTVCMIRAAQHIALADYDHHDFGLKNLMFDMRTGNVVVVDFGLAERQTCAPVDAWMKAGISDENNPFTKTIYPRDAAMIVNTVLDLLDMTLTSVENERLPRNLHWNKEKAKKDKVIYTNLDRFVNRMHKNAVANIERSDLDFEWLTDRRMGDDGAQEVIMKILLRDRIQKNDTLSAMLNRLGTEKLDASLTEAAIKTVLDHLEIRDNGSMASNEVQTEQDLFEYEKCADIISEIVKGEINKAKSDTPNPTHDRRESPHKAALKRHSKFALSEPAQNESLISRVKTVMANSAVWEAAAARSLEKLNRLEARFRPADASTVAPMTHLRPQEELTLLYAVQEYIRNPDILRADLSAYAVFQKRLHQLNALRGRYDEVHKQLQTLYKQQSRNGIDDTIALQEKLQSEIQAHEKRLSASMQVVRRLEKLNAYMATSNEQVIEMEAGNYGNLVSMLDAKKLEGDIRTCETMRQKLEDVDALKRWADVSYIRLVQMALHDVSKSAANAIDRQDDPFSLFNELEVAIRKEDASDEIRKQWQALRSAFPLTIKAFQHLDACNKITDPWCLSLATTSLETISDIENVLEQRGHDLNAKWQIEPWYPTRRSQFNGWVVGCDKKHLYIELERRNQSDIRVIRVERDFIKVLDDQATALGKKISVKGKIIDRKPVVEVAAGAGASVAGRGFSPK